MNTITITANVQAPIEKVWEYWTKPEHITKWNNASPDWHTPHASNDLKVGGAFMSRMESVDGSQGFDFGGIYTEVMPNERIAYTIGDGRTVEVQFVQEGDTTTVIETFEPETQNPEDMQRAGWQSILDNFKKYVESN